jgi:hypothetical protein
MSRGAPVTPGSERENWSGKYLRILSLNFYSSHSSSCVWTPPRTPSSGTSPDAGGSLHDEHNIAAKQITFRF